MQINITNTEKDFMKKMLRWDQKKASLESTVNSIFLIIGALVILVIAYLTIKHLNEYSSIWTIMPGYVIGILLLCIYLVGDIRIRERRYFASVLRKLLTKSKSKSSDS